MMVSSPQILRTFRRQRHNRSYAVYPAEQLMGAHVHLLCVFLTSHRVAIGTIVHSRYPYFILSHILL